MKVHDVKQGQPEWHRLRAGKITASRCKDARDRSTGLTVQQTTYVDALRKGHTEAEAKAIAGYKSAPRFELLERALAGNLPPVWSGAAQSYAAQVAVERIAGEPIDPDPFVTWQMREGQAREPHARAAYDIHTGNIVTEVGAISTDCGSFLYSPDGLVGKDGKVEVKCLFSAKVILQVLGQGDISEYVDQCRFGQWVTGRKWTDLVLWAPALANVGRDLTIIRVERDDNEIARMEQDLMDFAQLVQKNEHLLRGIEAPKAA
jgi:hypothetical protein